MILGCLFQIRSVNSLQTDQLLLSMKFDDHPCQFLALIFLQKMTRSLYRRMRLIARLPGSLTGATCLRLS
jgi:hypothetical protein